MATGRPHPPKSARRPSLPASRARAKPPPPAGRSVHALPARPNPPRPPPKIAERVFDDERTLLDVVDGLLNDGVVLSGELTLGLAGVDLVYLKLSALLCAADRLMPRGPHSRKSGR